MVSGSRRRHTSWFGGLLLLVVAGCGVAPPASPVATSAVASGTPSPPAASRTAPRPSSGRPTPTSVPTELSLVGDHRNSFAFASLDRPEDVTIEGRVSSTQAWSTSKVLIVAAYLDTVVDGDPDQISARNRRLITASLRESDAGAVNAIRDQIPGRSGRAMTAVLRSVGDRDTVAPDSYQGLMPWSLREQVRFMAALANGKVVSREASDYLMGAMRPIAAQRWGLGTIGATAYKGGWLRATTVTRQLGVVDGYAVAIITDGVGPVVRQTDGDSAHVRQLNRLAEQLEKRLAYEQAGVERTQ